MGDSEPDSAGPPDSVRQEAERLVVAALGAMRLAVTGARAAAGMPPAAGSAGRAGSATGGPSATGGEPSERVGGVGAGVTGAVECAFCPLCRAIATLRDPSPELAERLATAAGDLATGLTGLLRAFSAAAGPRTPNGTPVADPGAGRDTADEVWREATRTGHDSWPAPERDVPVAVPGAEAEVRSGRTVPPADAAGSARVSQPSAPPEPAGTEPDRATDAARRRVPASRAQRVPGAADDGPGRRD